MKMSEVGAKIRGNHPDARERLKSLMRGKTGLVTWVVSNCGLGKGGARKRYELVQKLVDMGLDVDRRWADEYLKQNCDVTANDQRKIATDNIFTTYALFTLKKISFNWKNSKACI